MGSWLAADVAVPEPTDIAWPKWAGWAVAMGVAAAIDYVVLDAVFNESGESATPSEGGNTNPYEGPVDAPVIVVDNDGNAIPVEAGEKITSSPNGDFQQVRDANGKPTGVRLDRGGHPTQADPKAQVPHAHRPGVTDDVGNPHLGINPRRPRP